MLIATLGLMGALQAANELDAAVLKLYSIISGPAGQKRDWDTFKAMFVDNAQMRIIAKREGQAVLRTITPQDYVDKSGPFLEKNGFFEKEIKRKSLIFGDMAQVWTSYESRIKEDDKPFDRGINAVSLVRVDGKWKIISITWTGEKDAGPLPGDFSG